MGLTRLTRLAVLLTLLALPVVALAASGSGRVLVPNCNKAQYKPKELTLACGDGSNFIRSLKWSSWTRTRASGTGVDEVNDCTPDCAAGRFKGYPVSVTLSKPKSCRNVKQKVFGHILETYGGSHPGRGRAQGGPLPCPS